MKNKGDESKQNIRPIKRKIERINITSDGSFREEVEDLQRFYSIKEKGTIVNKLIEKLESDEEEEKKFLEFYSKEYQIGRATRGTSVNITPLYLEIGTKKKIKLKYKQKMLSMSEFMRGIVNYYWKMNIESSLPEINELKKKVRLCGLDYEKIVVIGDYLAVMIKRSKN